MVKDPEGSVVGEDSRLEEEGPCVYGWRVEFTC